MSWWSRVARSAKRPTHYFDPASIAMPDWQLVNQEPLAAHWRDGAGDVICLSFFPASSDLPELSDDAALWCYCRDGAEEQSAGLIEVATSEGAEGRCLTYVYKRLEGRRMTFFAVAETLVVHGKWLWMVIANEKAVTGMRETLVTDKLLRTGQLTLESYQTSWASDPYAPEYAGVDQRSLRYISDAEEYDADFPDHPLSKVRRELRRVVKISIPPPPGADR
jgi:hypothetical protein